MAATTMPPRRAMRAPAAGRAVRPRRHPRPVVGSSSSHSGAGARASRASASRRFCPDESTRAGRSASGAKRQRRQRRRRPPRHAAGRRNRGSRSRSAPASAHPGATRSAGAPHGRRGRRRCPRPRQATAPSAGRSSPARMRSRVDLPAPLAPVSSSASPAASAKDRPGEDHAVAPQAGEVARFQDRLARLRHCRPPSMDRRRSPCFKPPDCAAAKGRLAARKGIATMRMIGQDSLKTRRTLNVDGKTYHYFSLPEAAKSIGDVTRLPYSLKVLLENVLRFEDGRSYTRGRREEDRRVGGGRPLHQGSAVPPGARAAAGLHRRACGGRPRRDARRAADAGRRPAQDQPAGAGRPGDRPLGDGGRIRAPPRRCRRTWRSSSSATASATNSSAGARRPSTISASCRRAPASATR